MSKSPGIQIFVQTPQRSTTPLRSGIRRYFPHQPVFCKTTTATTEFMFYYCKWWRFWETNSRILIGIKAPAFARITNQGILYWQNFRKWSSTRYDDLVPDSWEDRLSEDDPFNEEKLNRDFWINISESNETTLEFFRAR